jgi:hypothetical protein
LVDAMQTIVARPAAESPAESPTGPGAPRFLLLSAIGRIRREETPGDARRMMNILPLLAVIFRLTGAGTDLG